MLIRRLFPRRRLSTAEEDLLRQLAAGGVLKDQRDLDGRKEYHLRRLDGTIHAIDDATVYKLRRRGAISGNKKFPAATYLLTDEGRILAAELSQAETLPLSTRRYKSSSLD